MSMKRWDPWAEMMTLREAMGQLLEDSYVHPTSQSVTGDRLLLDVYEDADNIEVEAAMPGLRPEDVDITIHGDVLTIKGQHKAQTERKQGNYLVREQRSGNFYRSVQLPVQVDAEKARANFENGILHLTLPKAESTKPRTIRINSGNSQTIDQQPMNSGTSGAQTDGQREEAANAQTK
jgi:HSP20 family protein